ncbi:hypothetical protein [Shimia thalassica]|uniref:hypothetical protein n=1 Tax=Shimia thalassica TaxID=1715693 RepID=UPI0026E1F5A7|nr:hypothetical protein [Shimia thalassica]MDO6478299.1 hypothetical protein [Shimia thalassica]
MAKKNKNSEMDEILRARLSLDESAHLKLKLIKYAMYGFDTLNRVFTGQSFFALRETEAMLVKLNSKKGGDLVKTLLAQNGGTQITAHGIDNIPATGPVIIAATHPIGTFDFIAHAGPLLQHRPDLKVVANREAERFLGADAIIAVDLDKHHRALSARATQLGILAHLAEGGAVLIFGSGRVPHMENGLLVEPPWRQGTTRTSQASGAPVVPASADMRNSRHYFRTRKLARFFSGGNEDIAAKVGSLRYASELFAKLGGKYNVYYGPAQPPGAKAEDLKELAEALVPGLYVPD